MVDTAHCVAFIGRTFKMTLVEVMTFIDSRDPSNTHTTDLDYSSITWGKQWKIIKRSRIDSSYIKSELHEHLCIFTSNGQRQVILILPQDGKAILVKEGKK